MGKTINKRSSISTLIIHSGLLLLYTLAYLHPYDDVLAEKPQSKPQISSTSSLPANFDNEFRFYNEYGLKGKVAFTVKFGEFEKILSLDFNSKRIDKIIDGPGNNFYPSWSPKGDKIAFTSDRDGNKEIYIANADGSKQQRITSNYVADDNANWSPDGKQIAYYSGVDNSSKALETNIYLYDIEAKTHTKLTNLKGKNSVPEFSKDGKLIAYTTSRFWPGWDVCLLDMISKSDNCPLSGTSTYCRPSFSNDGKFIAYSSGLLSSVDAYTYNMETQSSEKLVDIEGNEYDLKWDKSDKYLIFASDKNKKELYNLYVVRVSDKAVSQILSAPYSLRYLSWYQE